MFSISSLSYSLLPQASLSPTSPSFSSSFPLPQTSLSLKPLSHSRLSLLQAFLSFDPLSPPQAALSHKSLSPWSLSLAKGSLSHKPLSPSSLSLPQAEILHSLSLINVIVEFKICMSQIFSLVVVIRIGAKWFYSIPVKFTIFHGFLEMTSCVQIFFLNYKWILVFLVFMAKLHIIFAEFYFNVIFSKSQYFFLFNVENERHSFL